jgi:hypothetical protein
MKKAGFIVALVAIIIDSVLTAIIINLAIQIGVDASLVILPIILLGVLITSIIMVSKDKRWAYGIIAVAAYSAISGLVNNGTLLPILPIAEIVGAVLILLDEKKEPTAAVQAPTQENKQVQ